MTVRSEAIQETTHGSISGYRAKRAGSATRPDTSLTETP